MDDWVGVEHDSVVSGVVLRRKRLACLPLVDVSQARLPLLDVTTRRAPAARRKHDRSQPQHLQLPRHRASLGSAWTLDHSKASFRVFWNSLELFCKPPISFDLKTIEYRYWESGLMYDRTFGNIIALVAVPRISCHPGSELETVC